MYGTQKTDNIYMVKGELMYCSGLSKSRLACADRAMPQILMGFKARYRKAKARSQEL